jgi:hypothetical protein
MPASVTSSTAGGATLEAGPAAGRAAWTLALREAVELTLERRGQGHLGVGRGWARREEEARPDPAYRENNKGDAKPAAFSCRPFRSSHTMKVPHR